MSPEQQRTTIAEFCGYEKGHGGWWEAPNGLPLTTKGLPNYLNDLNAMYEAWLKLSRNQRIAFSNHLRSVVVYSGIEGYDNDICCFCENATAAHRAEALLRAIGKWIE